MTWSPNPRSRIPLAPRGRRRERRPKSSIRPYDSAGLAFRSLFEGDDVAVRVLAPRGEQVPDPRDPVLGLEVGSVVLLEVDPALAEGGHNRFEVVNAEARERPPALARRHALVDHQ